MNIIIPMAGQGSRFALSDFALPKPLIDVAGKAMYRHAVDSMPLHLATKLIFILRESAFLNFLISDIKSNYFSRFVCSIVILNEDTRGQAETVLKGESVLNLNEPTLIHNCDSEILFDPSWENILKENIDGALILFESQEERWSYAKLDIKEEKIIDVQEKKVISSHASTGTYFFKDSTALINNIQTIINKNLLENNEYYLSTVFQLMLQQQKLLKPLWTKSFLCFGTPQDLVNSLNFIIANK